MAETFKGESRTNAHLKYPYTEEHEDDTFLDWEFTPAGGEGAVHKAFVDNPEGPWAHDVDGTVNDSYPYRGAVTPDPEPVYIETASEWNFSKRYITWESVLGTDGNIYTAKRNLPDVPDNSEYRPITGASWASYWEPIYEYAHGSGEKEDPYQVWTLADLFGVNYRLDAWYIQMADINASPAACAGYYDGTDVYNRFSNDEGDFVSIGWSNRWNGAVAEPYQGADFNGVYDGNGYAISDIRISKWVEGSGVFRKVGKGAIVKRLSVTDMIGDVAYAEESPENYYRGHKGGIAGATSGLIKDCFVSVKLSSGGESFASGNYFGGRLDANNAYMDAFGGIAGRVFYNGAVARCHTIVDVNQPPEVPPDPAVSLFIAHCGGIAGLNTGTIAHCSSVGAVRGTSFAGGIAGISGSVVITPWGEDPSSYVDFLMGGTIYNCMAHVDMTSNGGSIGGLVGRTNHNSTAGEEGEYAGCIVNCYSTGAITTGLNRAGLIGVTAGIKPEIIHCYYDSETSGQSDTGKGEPRTTAQMTGSLGQAETYVGWHPFAWVSGGYAGGYPSLNETVIGVATSVDFADINENRWGEYKQVADIDLGGTNRVGRCHIIDYETKYPSTNVEDGEYGRRWWGFSGEYDGDGYKITNLYINRGDAEEIQFRGLPEAFIPGHPELKYFALSKRGYHINQGLFSEVTYASEGLHNINLEGVEIEITVEPEDWETWLPWETLGWGIGGLVGGLSADVYNCHVEDVVITSYTDSVGGLIGRQYNTGPLATEEGLPTIAGCTATNVSVKGNTEVGGFIGNSNGYAFITDCTVTGVSVEGTYTLGGFGGLIYSSRADYPSSMPVEQRAPHLSDCEATDVFVTQSIEGFGNGWLMDSSGGFVGYLGAPQGVVKNCVLSNSIVKIPESSSEGGWAVGGFVGESETMVLECHTGADVVVEVPSISDYLVAGGFAGYNGGTLQDCYSRTTMDMDPALFDEGSYTVVGGLVGENNFYIKHCYAITSVTDNEGGNHPRGGLVGDGWYLGVINSYYLESGPAIPTLIKIADCYTPTTPTFSVSLDYGPFNNMVIERQDPMIVQHRFTNPPTGLTLKTKWRYLTPKLEHNVVCGFEVRGILIRYKLKGKKPKLIPEFD